MTMTRMKTVALQLLLTGAAICSVIPAYQALAEDPARPAAAGPDPVNEFPQPLLDTEQFAGVYRMIKPQPGELRFQEIPWLLSVWEARKKAAAEGKPILVWSGSGGAPTGVC
jgi:hypothetical protein